MTNKEALNAYDQTLFSGPKMPRTFYECDLCGEDIVEGDTYYEIYENGATTIICEKCIEESRREAWDD